MLIRLDEIKDRGLTREFTLEPAQFIPAEELDESDEPQIVAPLTVSVTLSRVDEMIDVNGSLATRIRCLCSRCLQEFESPLETTFELTYTKVLPQVEVEDGAEDEFELSADDLGLILLDGDEIDLQPALHDQLLLALPSKPLCSDGCRGLCPQCGQDLNQKTCDCAEPERLSRFAALKNFKVEPKGD